MRGWLLLPPRDGNGMQTTAISRQTAETPHHQPRIELESICHTEAAWHSCPSEMTAHPSNRMEFLPKPLRLLWMLSGVTVAAVSTASLAYAIELNWPVNSGVGPNQAFVALIAYLPIGMGLLTAVSVAAKALSFRPFPNRVRCFVLGAMCGLSQAEWTLARLGFSIGELQFIAIVLGAALCFRCYGTQANELNKH